MADLKFNVAEHYLRLLGTSVTQAQIAEDGLIEKAIVQGADGLPRALPEARVNEALEFTNEQLRITSENMTIQVQDYEQKSNRLLEYGKEGMQKLRHDGVEASLSEQQLVGVEAIVIADGSRPSLEFSNGEIDINDKKLGEWERVTIDFKAKIEKAARSIGRIDLNGEHRGTGFVIAENLIMTNRHVLQELAKENTPGNWKFKKNISINFGTEEDQKRFKILPEIVHTTDKTIDLYSLDFNKIDMAILRCEPLARTSFPPKLPVEMSQSFIVSGRPLYIIGYPGQPLPGAEPFKLLMELFDFRFGVKRYSPGQINVDLNGFTSIPNNTVLGHDCTTLGGNSGSPVIDIDDNGVRVVGLHFAGAPRKGNFAHSLAAIKGHFSSLNVAYIG